MFDLSYSWAISVRTGFAGLLLVAIFMRFFLRDCQRAKDRAVREGLSGPWGPMIEVMSWKWPNLYFMLMWPATICTGLLIQRLWPLPRSVGDASPDVYVMLGATIDWVLLLVICTFVFENYEEACRRDQRRKPKPSFGPATTA